MLKAMSLWDYIRTEVDNEIAEAGVDEEEAFLRICRQKWKMTDDDFVRFVLFRRSRMRETRTGRKTYLRLRTKRREKKAEPKLF